MKYCISLSISQNTYYFTRNNSWSKFFDDNVRFFDKEEADRRVELLDDATIRPETGRFTVCTEADVLLPIVLSS